MLKDAPVKLSPEQVEWVKSVPMTKRAAIVRDHILAHGSVTTQTLSNQYGYSHPPRARGDLQDSGVGVVTRMVTVDGKRMAEYYFTGAANKNAAGRVVIPKKFAEELKAQYGHRCMVCSGVFADRELQADHRVPFLIGGDKPAMVQEDFMPLCASDNRAKSWSCEHCENWTAKDVSMCQGCFWAHPERYEHIAGKPERRVNLVFQGDEVNFIDQLLASARDSRTPLEEMIKRRLQE